MKITKATRVFGFTDIHWSDRDKRALAVAEAAHRAFKPDITVIGGDLHNCGPFSRFAKQKIAEDEGYDLLTTELEPVAAFLDRIQAATTQQTIVLEGNHDEWIERWICSSPKGSAFRSMIPGTYHTKGRKNFKWIPYTKVKGDRKSCWRMRSDWIVVHGWIANKYAAQHHLNYAKNMNVIFHHTHRADHSWTTLWSGKSIEAFSAGCLCKFIPIYAHNGSPTDWVHGFWVAYVGRKSATAYPVIIHGSSAVLPDGSEVRL